MYFYTSENNEVSSIDFFLSTIQNIEGYCSENMCNFKVEPVPEGYRLTGEFSSTTPEEPDFFISYDHYGEVKVHSDISEFHRLWGEEWEKPRGA